MPAQRMYPDELRKRAVKMVLEIRERDGKGHGELAPVGRHLTPKRTRSLVCAHLAVMGFAAASGVRWRLAARWPRIV